ncbi:hypothetical protein Q5H92_26425 [Hymenobacter sp. M29]|uniref:Helix-turn-helix domain-containing protein n=1 Tax=Hymenobacter mellowenesis TaxID=3063995 RepID=A0ABT9AJ71_9BACT|nr:hypothetical protein [Hymenobacter sp. M29]MDO7849923.1 hypothetical protein [Hymenobacter sp. M29]
MTHLYKVPNDPTPTQPTTRKKPGELGLDFAASVLRLPMSMNARAVLAEIVSLHHSSARGCDASDQHFADRLTISVNTAQTCVKQLFDAKLISKTVDKDAGFYRVLMPRLAAIEAAAKLNPYPERGGRTTPKFGVGATPKTEVGTTPNFGVAYPKSWGSTTPEIGEALPQDLGTNTSFNLSANTSESFSDSSEPSASLAAPFDSKKNEGADSETVTNNAPQHVADNAAEAELVKPKSKPAAQKKIKPAGPAANLLPADCPLAELLNPGGDADRVQQLDKPLTAAQADALLAEFGFDRVSELLLAMANYKPLLKNSTSANLTARKWFERRAADAKKNQHENLSNHSDSGSGAGRRAGARFATNGAKPDDDAAEFARALAQSRRTSSSDSQ